MVAPPLLAAGLDWLEGILPLLFLLFWIVSQVRAFFRGAEPPKPPQQRPAPRPPAMDDARDELARQIEEFVRRSSSARQAPRQPQRRRDRGDRPVVPGPPQRTAGLPSAPTSRREPPRAARASGAAPPALGSLGGHGTDVARHVREAFADQIEHLPAGLAGSTAAVAPVIARQPATDLVAALRDPATLRQMVLVREVLDRPVERW